MNILFSTHLHHQPLPFSSLITKHTTNHCMLIAANFSWDALSSHAQFLSIAWNEFSPPFCFDETMDHHYERAPFSSRFNAILLMASSVKYHSLFCTYIHLVRVGFVYVKIYMTTYLGPEACHACRLQACRY